MDIDLGKESQCLTMAPPMVSVCIMIAIILGNEVISNTKNIRIKVFLILSPKVDVEAVKNIGRYRALDPWHHDPAPYLWFGKV